MIIKELDPAQNKDKFEKAGRQAEEQMAFYLSRAFKDDKKVYVFNSLRFVRDNDVAQIDHLVLHKNGIIIIESKSVTTEVRVDEHGAWTRLYMGAEHGMKSPIIQAQMQATLLRQYLEDHIEELLKKLLGVQKHLRAMPMDVLVAISDRGVLRRAPGAAPEACKADQVVGRVSNLIDDRRKAASLFSLRLDTGFTLSDDEVSRLIGFLLKHHTPDQRPRQTNIEKAPPAPPIELRRQSYQPQQSLQPEKRSDDSGLPQVAQPGSKTTCAKCGGTRLTLEYKFNFFLRCADCRGATPLVLRCSQCGMDHGDVKKPDTFKDHNVWSLKCSHCGHSIPVEVPQAPMRAGVTKSGSGAK